MEAESKMNAKRYNRLAATAVVGAMLGIAGHSAVQAANCVNPFDGTMQTPAGDVNGDNLTNVIDAHCMILVSLWYLGGAQGTAPACAATPINQADLNCSGSVDITDVQLSISIALGLGLSNGVDPEGDGCANPCQPEGWTPRPMVVPIYAGGASAGGAFTVTPIGTGAAVNGTTGSAGSDGMGGPLHSIRPDSQGDPQPIP
jgi:hypothetical protein